MNIHGFPTYPHTPISGLEGTATGEDDTEMRELFEFTEDARGDWGGVGLELL